MPELLGRDRPATVLQAEINRTLDSHGGLVFVTGEAGIGKTALVTEAAGEAGRRGALVATGACWDRDGAPGYWPWVQVLRSLQRTVSAESWAAARAEAGGELSLLLGEVSAQQRSNPTSETAFGLSDAVTTLLVTLSRHTPLVVVLDDLHWADPPSIRLLEFVARHAWFEQLLVVGTYRDAEVEAAGHPLGPVLLPLVAKATTTVALTGLDPDAVGALLARTAGRQPTARMVREVHRRTGGNPFFVDQTAQLWLSMNSVDAIAPGVRDAIERRLQLLPDDVLELLLAAAVLGPELHRDVLAASAGLERSEVDRLLGDAAAARLMVPREEGRWAFVHDLVRETLYDRLSTAEARKRHAAVVVALAHQPDLARHASSADLAHHAYLAVPEVAPAEAVGRLRQAAQDAWRRFAVDEAARHLYRALELVPDDDPRQRAMVALELGSAQHHLAEMTACYRSYEQVADIARALDDPVLLARAALRLRGAVWLVHSEEIAQLVTRLVNEAHARLIGDDGPPKTDLQREQELSLRAIELARESGDDDALLDGLVARYDAIWAPGTAAERERIADDVSALARRTADRSSGLYGACLRLVAQFERGEPAWREELAFATSVAEAMNTAFSRSMELWCRAQAAAFDGRFDDARAYNAEATELDREIYANVDTPNDRSAVRRQQEWGIELLQGRYDRAEVLAHAAHEAGHPHPDLLAALTAVQRGDVAAARRYLDETTATGAYPSRWFTPMWLRLQAQVAAASRDPQLCEKARAELAPVIDDWAVTFGDTPHGPMRLWSALIDAAEERWDEAVAGLRAAAEAADRVRARPWSIETRAHLAQALLARGDPDDVDTAAALLDTVEREATETGMLHLATRARRARADLQRGAARSPAAADAAAPAARSAPAADAAAESMRGAAPPGAVAGAAAPPAARSIAAIPPSAARSGAGTAAPPEARSAAGAAAGSGTGAERGGSTTGVTPAAADDRAGDNAFRFDGQVWTLRYAGETVHMPDAKGLRDLHVLLGLPGSDVRAAELANPEGGDAVRASGRLGADPVLDEQAKAAYRQRLTQLDDEIDRAVLRHDDRRAAELDRERAALIDELRRATGLGGRSRRLGSQAERARKPVSERIRDTLRRLDRAHPQLAAHLRDSISTGIACRYQPSDPIIWNL